MPWEFLCKTSGFQVPEPLCSSRCWDFTPWQQGILIMDFLMNIRKRRSHQSIQPMLSRTVMFSLQYPWSMLVTPKSRKNWKSLRAGTENKDQNKQLTRQGLYAWRAAQRGQPWHKPQFNHSFHRFIYYYCLCPTSRILITSFFVFFPVSLISIWFQLIRY